MNHVHFLGSMLSHGSMEDDNIQGSWRREIQELSFCNFPVNANVFQNKKNFPPAKKKGTVSNFFSQRKNQETAEIHRKISTAILTPKTTTANTLTLNY